MTDYAELHAASAFSFLESASLPEALVDAAADSGVGGVALLDRNGVYGVPRLQLQANKRGIAAFTGAEVACRDFAPRLTPQRWLKHQHKPEPSRVPLLCTSLVGYQNLCQMITRYKMREHNKAEGSAMWDDLAEYAGGLVCLTGGDEGPLASALCNGGEAEGREVLKRLVRIYGRGNVYVELQRHGLREQEWRNQAALSLAASLGLPVLATNGVRYASKAEREILDVLTCVRNHTSLDRAGRLLCTNSHRHMRSGRAMAKLFHDIPEAIENTALLASRLDFRMESEKVGYQFPAYPTPDGMAMDDYLRKLVTDGIEKRYGPFNRRRLTMLAKIQAEKELALIQKLGFAGYFLIVHDIIRFCGNNNILIQGRGSAANSVVCYALEVTAVDPIRMKMLFERFLSENRNEWPDIDLDLPSGDKREQAIQYVYERYGQLGAAMTANVITYRGKSAAREVGKALGFDPDTQARLASVVSQWEWRGPTDTFEHSFRNAGLEVQHPRIAKYLELCMRLQDLPRHLGQHSGGMVICAGLLNKVVPLERASMPGRTVVQWDKEDCAQLGIIKVDLLGLGMMAVMKDCIDLIPKHYGDEVHLARLPKDDEATYAVLRNADTVGMFQVESRAQMASIPRNAPRKFYDLVVQVAIIRPGPIVGKMMHPYMRRRQGKEKVTYPTESLKPVLKRTLGVPLFQEQLLRMAMVVADFTGAEAEELRKAVGMRRSMARMKELSVKLRDGMARKNIPVDVQAQIVDSISSFALYGFPESHAASFALIAYASAFFKVKYLAAFTCAILNNQPMGFYSPAVLVKDAQRHGLRVKPVDVQRSDAVCSLEHEPDGTLSLRLGLNYVRGLHTDTAMAVQRAREAALFASNEDLSRRVSSLSRRDLTQLARIGALNWIEGIEHRRDALWQVEQIGRGAGPLLASAEVREPSSPLQKMSTEDRLVADYEGTGLTIGKHPLAYRRAELRRDGILSAADLQHASNGNHVRAAGCVIARQRPGTAKGFIFLSMEDETGIMNVIVEPGLYEHERTVVTRAKFLLVEGPVQNEDAVVHIRAKRLVPLQHVSLAMESHDFH